jgi:hypothetical protein
MSKKVRTSSRTNKRPGSRPAATQRNAPRLRPTAPVSELETAEIVAADVEEGRPATAAAVLESNARQRGHSRVKPGSLLAAKAATEYVYVAKDMRRILLVAGALAGVMLILWLLLVVMRVVHLPFY